MFPWSLELLYIYERQLNLILKISLLYHALPTSFKYTDEFYNRNTEVWIPWMKCVITVNTHSYTHILYKIVHYDYIPGGESVNVSCFYALEQLVDYVGNM